MQRKPLTKFNTHYDKNSPESRHRRNIPQHNKSHIWKTHKKYYPQWWKIESISPEVRNKTRVLTLTTSFATFSQSNQRIKRNKKNPDWKRRSKTLTVCRWYDPLHQIRSDQIRSVAQSCPTLCDPMNCSTPGLPVHHQLPEFTETHVHRVSYAIQPSHPLSSPSPLAPNPSQHQSLFQWVNSSHEVAKVLEFQL